MSEVRARVPAPARHARRAELAVTASRRALADFVACQGVRLDDGTGQLSALVTYRSPFGTLTLATRVIVVVAGRRAGRVRLAPRAVLTTDWYELDFSAEWADYSLQRPADRLIISGSSQRMGGGYRVWLESLPSMRPVDS